MDALLTKQRIHIEPRQDRVVLMLGKLEVEMPYATSFQVAQGLRLASKDAMRYAKEDVTNWQTFATLDEMPKETLPYKVSPEHRVTVRKNFNWKAGWEGENVKVMFGDQVLKFHFTVALKIAVWLRDAGHRSKAWAGDGSKSMIMAGRLSDAEENYRLGIK
jgi:hypothetical protein